MNEHFWNRCIAAQCFVLPVRLYTQYGDDGNLHDEYFVGIRFAALPFENEAVGDEYWFMIEEGQSGLDKLYKTPEEALQAFERG